MDIKREYVATKLTDTVFMLRVTEQAPLVELTETQMMGSHGWELSDDGFRWCKSGKDSIGVGFMVDDVVGIRL